jgi:topoisomerase-4 subunit A
MIENENKEEVFISEHPKSFLELVSTDWRPVVEIEFSKPRGKDAKPNQIIDIEDFISIKGIKALGNQLTSEKVKNINSLDPLPFEEPVKNDANEIEVIDEENIGTRKDHTAGAPETEAANEESGKENKLEREDGEGQTTLF